MPENLDLAELKRLDDERRRTNDSDSPDAGEADYQYELYLREHTADIIAMGAELERLHAAHQALSIVNNTEARYEARNKLRRFLQGHIPAILAMGAERERLRGERDALAAQVEYICDELEDDCDVIDGPGGPHPNRASRLRADIHRVYAMHVRTYQHILAARDAAVQAEVTELKAANVKLEARIAELEEELAAWEDWTD